MCALVHALLQRGIELQDFLLGAVLGGDVVIGQNHQRLVAAHHAITRYFTQYGFIAVEAAHAGQVAFNGAAGHHGVAHGAAFEPVQPEGFSGVDRTENIVAMAIKQRGPGRVNVHQHHLFGQGRHRHRHRRSVENSFKLGLADAQFGFNAVALLQFGLQIGVLLVSLFGEHHQFAAHGLQALSQATDLIWSGPVQWLFQITVSQTLRVQLQFLQWPHHTLFKQYPDQTDGYSHLGHQSDRHFTQGSDQFALNPGGGKRHFQMPYVRTLMHHIAVFDNQLTHGGLRLFLAGKDLLEFIGHFHAHDIGVAHHGIHQFGGRLLVYVPNSHAQTARQHCGLLLHRSLDPQFHFRFEFAVDLEKRQHQRWQKYAQARPQKKRLAQGQRKAASLGWAFDRIRHGLICCPTGTLGCWGWGLSAQHKVKIWRRPLG